MKTKIFALFCFCLLAFATMCSAGDSTSIAPAGVTKQSHTYTNGDNVYTGGGHIYTNGGDIRQVDQLKANRLYAKGSGSWINVYDHFDMNNRVIYDVKRIRVNDYTPSYYKDVASKWYVDKKASSSLDCTTVSRSVTHRGRVYCPGGYKVTGGGCNMQQGKKGNWTRDQPYGNGWYCRAGSYYGYTAYVYARCCRVR